MKNFMSEPERLAKPDRSIDLTGLYCPEPVFRTKQAIDLLNIGKVLEVLADDPAAEEDIIRWARRMGQEIISIDKNGKVLRFKIRKVR